MGETSFVHVTKYSQYGPSGNIKSPSAVSNADLTDYTYNQYADSVGKEITYSMSFSDITDWSNIRITGYKVRGRGGYMNSSGSDANKKKSYLEFWLCTNFSKTKEQTSSFRLTKIDESNTHLLFGTKDGNSNVGTANSWFEYEVTNANDASVVWMNNNKTTLADASDFGIYIEGKDFRLYELGMILYYAPNSTIYAGGGCLYRRFTSAERRLKLCISALIKSCKNCVMQIAR